LTFFSSSSLSYPAVLLKRYSIIPRFRREVLMAIKRLLALVLLVCGVLLGAASAQTERVLHSFCAQSGCADGSGPKAGLVFDQKGNLYGTTSNGGTHNSGTVFRLTPAGKETVLHSFCKRSGCTDGATPYAGVVIDQNGNLYGTTSAGGTYSNMSCGSIGCGVVFKLTPNGKYTVFYNFCAKFGCDDGALPLAGLVFDQKGNLYGTTRNGGAFDSGTVFKLTPTGKETVLYSFCGSNCDDGALPLAGLVFDQKGNLYGTTSYGGASNSSCVQGCGVVFKLTPAGKETLLYSFCAQNNCIDGAVPYAGLIVDQTGNLYGTTLGGGAYHDSGVVFKITPAGKETVLYSFCAQGYPNCTDGDAPFAGVVLDQKGNLYGTTSQGGAYNFYAGAVFKLTPTGKETVLHSFCAQIIHCPDGENPLAGLIFDQKGNLYGTAAAGGANNSGVIFKLTP
jgi:uncharacterized repeat protein (TIGR03803 family)